MRLKWLVCAGALGIVLSLLNMWALSEFLYWKYDWFDVFMHFLGGVVIGLFAVGLCMHFRPRVFVVFTATAFIAWELFEYYFGIPREDYFWFDTWLDILMDTIGALVVYGVARLTTWRTR